MLDGVDVIIVGGIRRHMMRLPRKLPCSSLQFAGVVQVVIATLDASRVSPVWWFGLESTVGRAGTLDAEDGGLALGQVCFQDSKPG
jgi:hypothetical protein